MLQMRRDPESSLWEMSATARERRWAVALASGYLLVVVLALPWIHEAGPTAPGVVAVFTTAVVVADLATALILLSQDRTAPHRTALVASCAYLFSAVFGTGHLLTFPGAVIPGRPVFGGPQIASYTYLVWRLGFAGLMALAAVPALVPAARRRQTTTRLRWTAAAATVILAVAALVLLLVFGPQLPPMIDAAGRYNDLDRSVSWTAAALSALACLGFWAAARRPEILYLWVALALTACTGDVAVSNLAGARYSGGWYLARASGCLSAATLFIFFLMRFTAHQRAVVESAAALLRQASDLELEVERRHVVEGQLQAAVAERKIFADVIETADVLVQVLDPDYRWMAVNKAAADDFERLFGVRPAVGQSLIALLADQPRRQAVAQTLWRRALDGEEFVEVREFARGTDQWFCYEMHYNAMRDPDGRILGAFQFIYDVTPRVREQQRLARAEAALHQAQKMETIGQLTGGVAHDFNNLLTPIVGALDILVRRFENDPRNLRLISGALQSAERARILIQRLMAFARRQHLEPRTLNIGALIDDISDLIGRTLGPQIALKVEIATDLPPARVDANQFELALLNLAVNARDAMAGAGLLTISADRERVTEHAHLPAGDYVRVAVTDTGAGMDAETLARAIEPFFTTKGVGQGTGLGLSMVHGLAAQLGGDFSLVSEPGAGTTAILRLPVSAETVDAPASPAAEAPSRQAERAVVLLVDDEELVRAATGEMLRQIGYEVVDAPSAQEGLQLLRGGLTPAAVVTDFAMPGMDGAEFSRVLRMLRPDLPILIVTGYAALAEAAGLPRLAKPFRQSELAEALAAMLEPQGETVQ